MPRPTKKQQAAKEEFKDVTYYVEDMVGLVSPQIPGRVFIGRTRVEAMTRLNAGMSDAFRDHYKTWAAREVD